MIDDASLEVLAKFLRDASENNFTGSVQINFFKGSVSNIAMQQSFKMESLVFKAV